MHAISAERMRRIRLSMWSMKNSMFVRTADTMHFSAVTGAVNGITPMISHTAMIIQESYIANGVMRRWHKCAKGSQSLYCCLYCYAYRR